MCVMGGDMIGQIGSGQGHPVFYHGPRKCPAEDEILPSIVDTTRNSAFLLASRCVAQPAEEPSATVCENTASTATTDEEEKATDVEKCLDEDNCVIYLIIMSNLYFVELERESGTV